MLNSLVNNLEIYMNGSHLLAYAAVYVGGILVSLTPCVYPVLPVIVAFVGGQSAGSKLKGFILSLFYVLGMSLTYTLLGGFASLTGKIFGQIQSNPVTYLIIANIFIIFGLSMLDVFVVPIPAFLSGFQPKETKKGIPGSFFLGIVSGFIVGPCTAPVLGVLLSYLATRQNVAFGTSLLFVFSVGMGTIMLVLGTFTGLVTGMPRAGRWMIIIKKIFGVVMLAMAEYFLVLAGKYFL